MPEDNEEDRFGGMLAGAVVYLDLKYIWSHYERENMVMERSESLDRQRAGEKLKGSYSRFISLPATAKKGWEDESTDTRLMPTVPASLMTSGNW